MRAMGVAVVVAAAACLVPARVVAQGLVFSITPNQQVQSASLGFRFGRLVPFAGVDLLSASAEGTLRYESVDRYTGSAYGWNNVDEETLDAEGSATLVIPHLGLKAFLADGELRPYVLGSAFKSLVFVDASATNTQREESADGDDVAVWEDEDRWSLSDDKGLEDAAKDVLGFTGITIGGGVEYFPTERFSVGGEYGIRLVSHSVSGDYDNLDEDGSYYWREQWEAEVSGSYRLSYGTVSLNFYF